MLYDLTIRNIVLIDRLDLEFAEGLSVLSGETGAGKSILLDSLGLALGGRSDAGLIRQGAQEASVSISFIVSASHPANRLLQQHDITVQDKIYIRRKITHDGKSRAMVNDQSVTVTFLKQLGGELIEIQGQFDQHRLLNPARHLYLLDSFGNINTNAIRQAFADYQQAINALETHQQQTAEAKQEQEFIAHSIEELERLNPQPDEIDNLTVKRHFMMNAEKIRASLSQAEQLLTGQTGSITQLEQSIRHVQAITLDDDIGKQLKQNLETALIEMNDGQKNLSMILSTLDSDNMQLQEIDDRLFALKDVARKHRIGAETLSQLLETLRQKASLIDAGDDMLAQLQAQKQKAYEDYVATAKQISTKRIEAKKQLEQAIMQELPALKMELAQFTVNITQKAEAQWDGKGMDNVQFMLCSNPGQAVGALNKIASGGELSRVILALNLVFSKIRNIAVLLFDEVDSGIGGQTAAFMGKRLLQLSHDRQVIVITHSPQISALGKHHFHVSKLIKDGSTISQVKLLSAQERLEEVARMVSDGTITNAARAAALKLLQGGHQYQETHDG
ncbi:MAG: DNA repair protein RecN [Alphaproteobacteria bacterium]|nr:DNA repair protein RecN [Alphaproteobacteria bacterium]